MMELVEMEVRELLTNYGYDGDNSPVIININIFLFFNI
jgi:translation elongation factor EF-Tu-like GTPase